jgi:hypothetical protein
VVAGKRWPRPGREALDVALEESHLFATPLAQYWPDRLVRDRVVLLGDTAHAASPMVGGGFRHGLYDAAVCRRSSSGVVFCQTCSIATNGNGWGRPKPTSPAA